MGNKWYESSTLITLFTTELCGESKGSILGTVVNTQRLYFVEQGLVTDIQKFRSLFSIPIRQFEGSSNGVDFRLHNGFVMSHFQGWPVLFFGVRTWFAGR